EPLRVRPESEAVTPGSNRKTPLVPPLMVRPAAGPVTVVISAVWLSSSGAPARVIAVAVLKTVGSNVITATANWLARLTAPGSVRPAAEVLVAPDGDSTSSED